MARDYSVGRIKFLHVKQAGLKRRRGRSGYTGNGRRRCSD